jgi:uncharacterized BrkB/YihY/UPF0761 family membrane protein
MIGLWITAAVCVALALLFFSGRGGFLIMGYNTAPPEKKALYHKDKLFRAVGVLMLVLAAMTAALALYYEPLKRLYTYGVVGAILVCMFYVLQCCREEDSAPSQPEEK